MISLTAILLRIARHRLSPNAIKSRAIQFAWTLSKKSFWSPVKNQCILLHKGVSMGYGSYSSDGLNLRLANGTIVGNYCSIGPGVVSFNANHPDHFFTTHPILYNPKCGHVTSDQLDRITLEIGHDVWIGANSIILPKVKRIGNGAIIGAGAVITKDVPPYAVVAGNPGKILKYRFSESTIADLEKTKWWDSTMESLKKNTHCLNTIASPVHNLKTAIPQYSNFEKPANTIRHQGTMHLDEKIK